MKLEDRLKKARDYANLTQADLAKKAEISLRAIAGYEKDASKMQYGLICKIANICMISEIWLLTGQGDIEDSSIEFKQAGNGPKKRAIDIRRAVIAEHTKIIKKFDDGEAGKEINEDLVFIEQSDKESFYEVKGYIKGIANGLRSISESSKQQGRSGGQLRRKTGGK